MNSDSSSGRSPHRLKDRFREETAQAVLSAAEQVFAEQGLHGASMNQIAERAGVAVGTLYNHFKDKEALLRALLDHRRQELLGRLDRGLAEHTDAPFRVELEGFLRAMFEHFEEHRNFILILMQGEHERAEKHQEAMRAVYTRVDQLIKAGCRKKALRADIEPFAAAFLMGTIKSMMMRAKFADSSGDLRKQVKAVAGFFLDGAGR